jgi:hypothetical protein
MFASWWSRKQNKSSPEAALPDLDREVAAHWNRGVAPPATPTEKPPGDSLDFGPIASYAAAKRYVRALKRLKIILAALPGGLEGL